MLVFWEVIFWLPHSLELFSDQGLHQGLLENFAPEPEWARILCMSLLVSSFVLALGLLTKISLVITLVLLGFLVGIDQTDAALLTRNTISIIALFLLLMMPCGRFYSLDACIRHRWSSDPESGDSTMPGLMFRLLQILFLQMYFFSGLNKLLEPSWRNGAALADALSGRFSTDLGLWIAGWMPMIGYKVLGFCVILFGLLAPYALNSMR